MVGEKAVEGLALKQFLIKKGYRSAYMVAGPEVNRTLIADQVLDRMFLSTHCSLLGGNAYHTMLEGDIGNTAQLELRSLYLDQMISPMQFFAHYALST